ncbi:hypothetical protein KGQ20_43240 [Catenulispora sp. NF23]|uniref:Rod shape-determining protein MreD n=1 Tax=Catenulispora pinistramenti TaxID=2705254 RepID=A0ABS5L7C1_9ACTN|nr:hypothetical protein [Catenulispora pinistramenti]MBS2539578.1 hypothetical protein [Catenulispora pinistramenti]MBS2554212.1 hypothetical protein [Catenulispora pinistramenti]
MLMSLAVSGTILALATLAAGPVRTYPLRVYLGAGLAGFLVDSALVRLDEPAAEDVVNVLVLVLVVVLAARRRDVRPSALDLTLLGLWTGVGVGHLLDTGIVGLGLGIGVLYRRRWRLAWMAAPAGLVMAFAIPSWIVASLLVLSSGTAAMAWFEWRHGTQRRLDPTGYASSSSAIVPVLWHVVPRWLWLTAAEGARRGARLAELQRADLSTPGPLRPRPAAAQAPPSSARTRSSVPWRSGRRRPGSR